MWMSDFTPVDWDGHVILCGFGRVGHRILNLLIRLDRRTVVISKDPPIDWPPSEKGDFPYFTGNAQDDQLLKAAGIERADSIIIVTNDDLTNVSIALDSRRLNPHIKIVVRLFDQQLAAQLEKAAGIGKAFSASALAAPAFVAATLGEGTRGAFDTHAGVCHIEEVILNDKPQLARTTLADWERQNSQAVMAIQRGRDCLIDLSLGTELLPGDRLLTLGTEAVKKSITPHSRGLTNIYNRSAHIFRAIRNWWSDLPSSLRIILVLVFGVVLLSVLLFHKTLGLNWVDSLYFVVTTITTVGFGDYNLLNAHPMVKLYGTFLMLCGAALLAILFSLVTDLVVSIRLRDVLSYGYSHASGHIIVAGLGNIGFRLTRELARRGAQVVAIEKNPAGKFVETARTLGHVLAGDIRTEETLEKAGISGACAFLAVTDDDIANLGAGLRARRSNSTSRVVLRVYDSQLAGKIPATLGVDSVLSVAAESAPSFVAAALDDEVIYAFIHGDFLLALFKADPTPSKNLKENERALYNFWAADSASPRTCSRAQETLKSNPLGIRWYRLRVEA
jgi:Trk K+ transport system NAD-binding subunit